MGETDLKGKFRLEASEEEEIKFVQQCSEADMQKFNDALNYYKTYQKVIEASNVRNVVTSEVPFEIFGENIQGRLTSLSDKLD